MRVCCMNVLGVAVVFVACCAALSNALQQHAMGTLRTTFGKRLAMNGVGNVRGVWGKRSALPPTEEREEEEEERVLGEQIDDALDGEGDEQQQRVPVKRFTGLRNSWGKRALADWEKRGTFSGANTIWGR